MSTPTPQEMTLDAIRSVPLFASLDDEAAAELRSLLRTREAKAGAILFRAGDMGDAMYLIESGKISTALSSPPRGIEAESAAAINPRNVTPGVPTRSVIVTARSAFGSTPSISPRSGVTITSGRPVTSQCARPFAAAISSSGMDASIS